MSLRRLQLALALAGAAALVIMFDLFSTEARLAALGVIVIVTVLTSGERRLRGGGWWGILAVGAAGSLLAFGLAELSEDAGGIAAIIGSALVAIAATVGFPLGTPTR